MVDLSCVDLSIDDMLQCSFGLSRLELSVLLALLGKKTWASTSALALELGKDRSVVQRGISSLMGKGLAEREQSNKERGGYEYVYRAKGKDEIKGQILANSRAFCAMVRETVQGW
jgi:predicted transcriptional regulator